MGKKGKKANKKKSSGTTRTPKNNSSALPETPDNSSDASKTKTVPFCIPDPPEPTSTNYIDRQPPPLEMGNMSYVTNLDERLNDILSCNRTKASLPTSDELAKLKSKTAKCVATALSRFEIARELLFVEQLEATTKKGRIQLYRMDDLTSNESVLKACVHMILALEDTDLRLCPCAGPATLDLWPIPYNYFFPIEYHPLNQGEMQMHELSNEEFVILLATVLVVGQSNICESGQDSLRLVHELYLQVKNIEWSRFSWNKHLKVLTEKICRNALAGIGIKICRLLYFMKKSHRCELPSDEKFSSKALLKMIEEFARHQMKYSESGNSECVMGWIATQSPAILKVDPLCASADALHWYTKAYTKADKHGNDFISSVARIQAAYCFHCCGDGIISVNETVLLRRDFRTEFGEKEKNGHEKLGIFVFGFVDRQNQNLQQVEDRELERLESDKPLTELTSEEKHWVDWKKSLTLWNEAMKYYDYMADIGMGNFIYAETAQWEYVLYHFKFLVDETEISLDRDVISPLGDIGIRRRRDTIIRLCANCENMDGTKQCSKCKKAFYCSRECQKAHWAKHKLTCCKKVADKHREV